MNGHPPDYFEVLAYHPHPRPFESLTSYLTRLAQGNGINKGVDAWLYLSFPPPQSGPRVHSLSDYPPARWGLLPLLTNRSEPELLATTFYYLTQKFGRAARPQAMGRFLQSCLSQTLRFCPACLAEDAFYALPWRLLTLTGCAKHGCRLVEHCGHCGQPIPFLTRPLAIGRCPSCGGDLRVCQTELLPANEWDQVIEHDQDLRFLLAPDPTIPVDPQEAIRFVGLRLAYWRLEQGQMASELGGQFEFPDATIYGLEGRVRWGATFERYVRYAAYLGVSFRQLFTTTLPPEVNQHNWRTWCRTGLSREQSLVKQVQAAISSLQAEQEPLSQAAIARRVGKSAATFYRYPSVKAVLQPVVAGRKSANHPQAQQQERALLSAVPSALAHLKENGILPSRARVSRLVSCHILALNKYQRVKAMIATAAIEFYLDRQQQLQQRQQALPQYPLDPVEKKLVVAVKAALESLRATNKPVSQRSISQLVGVPQSRLKEQPQIRLIFEQMALDHDLARQRQVLQRASAAQPPECRFNPDREAELFEAMQAAISQLRREGKPISQRTVATHVGLDQSTLIRYPRLKVIFDRLRQDYAQLRQARRQHYEQELMARVQAAIASIEALNQPLLQSSIAQLVGIDVTTLRHYPQVKALLSQFSARRHQILIEQRQQRDLELADKVKQAAATLSQGGHPVTKQAIGQLVGLSPSGLKKYPRAEATLAQVTQL